MLSTNCFFRPLLWPTIITALALPFLAGLGFWQIERLHWKRALIATMEERLAAPAMDAPPRSGWPELDVAALEYRHVRLAGRFDHEQEFHYFTQDDEGTAGYDIVTPLRLDDGGIVLVDRGFVPAGLKERASRAAGEVGGRVVLTGILRAPQPRGSFSAPDDVRRNIWFVRDPARMAQAADLGGVAPFFVEADAAPNPGGWPKGGRTRLHIRNEHLQYAITWFGLAAALFAIYLIYHASNGRIGRPRPVAENR